MARSLYCAAVCTVVVCLIICSVEASRTRESLLGNDRHLSQVAGSTVVGRDATDEPLTRVPRALKDYDDDGNDDDDHDGDDDDHDGDDDGKNDDK